MNEVAIAVLYVLGLFLLAQAAMAIGFVWFVRHRQYPELPDGQCPRVAVILCVRGKDPFLNDCLVALANQDYPNYDTCVIVDHQEDPARRLVQRHVEAIGSPSIRWEVLQNPRDTCSLKCSSLVQVAGRLDSSYEAIALLDSDTIPHASWLRELIAPLQDDRCGASTGNRWYMPATPSVGAVIRYFWNAFAIVQMYWFGIPWGGTLAVKMDVIRNSDLLNSWSHAFCEDTMMRSILREQKLRLAFVPSLIIINREDCNVGTYSSWVCRQLLTVRLYHGFWPAVIIHGLLSAVLPLLLLIAFVWALMNENWTISSSIVISSLVYVTSLALLLWPMEASVRAWMKTRGEPTAWMSPLFYRSCVVALPLLQILYPIALASAFLLRRVAWRGVEYEVDGPWHIRMIGYRPYRPTNDKATVSL